MSVINWPDTPLMRPASVEFRPFLPEEVSRSAFNGSTQGVPLGPAYWLVTVAIGPRRASEVPDWEAFLDQLLETRNRVRLWDWRREAPRGSGAGGGTIRVNGAGQTGRNLATDGWPAGVNGVLLPADYVGVNGELRRVISQANANGGGQATLALDQPLRASPPDDAVVTIVKPTGLFICTTDKASRGFVQDGARHRGPTLDFMEVFA